MRAEAASPGRQGRGDCHALVVGDIGIRRDNRSLGFNREARLSSLSATANYEAVVNGFDTRIVRGPTALVILDLTGIDPMRCRRGA